MNECNCCRECAGCVLFEKNHLKRETRPREDADNADESRVVRRNESGNKTIRARDMSVSTHSMRNDVYVRILSKEVREGKTNRTVHSTETPDAFEKEGIQDERADKSGVKMMWEEII